MIRGINTVALMRFRGFHLVHNGDGAFGLLVMGVTVAGILMWALSRPGRNESARIKSGH